MQLVAQLLKPLKLWFLPRLMLQIYSEFALPLLRGGCATESAAHAEKFTSFMRPHAAPAALTGGGDSVNAVVVEGTYGTPYIHVDAVDVPYANAVQATDSVMVDAADPTDDDVKNVADVAGSAKIDGVQDARAAHFSDAYSKNVGEGHVTNIDDANSVHSANDEADRAPYATDISVTHVIKFAAFTDNDAAHGADFDAE